uniref:Uncharacterized protein n=1 Tax=Anguilla anguilla TaxID=7936 RepID=A0A0E9VUJ1_ANGAN
MEPGLVIRALKLYAKTRKLSLFRLGDAPETSGVPWVSTAKLQI